MWAEMNRAMFIHNPPDGQIKIKIRRHLYQWAADGTGSPPMYLPWAMRWMECKVFTLTVSLWKVYSRQHTIENSSGISFLKKNYALISFPPCFA
jgi:hypothetical protein